MVMNTLRRITRAFARDDSGSSSAEFALVLPAFLILIFGAIAGGALMYSVVNLQRTAEISARCLSAQRTDCDIADITPFAVDRYNGVPLGNLTFAASDADASCDGYLVTASGTLNWFAGSRLLAAPLSTRACYPGPY